MISRSFLGLAVGLMAGLPNAAWSGDDLAESVARLHEEAMGGASQIRAVNGLYLEGYHEVEGNRISFRSWHGFPGKSRVETELSPGEMLVEGVDGLSPWQLRIVDGEERPAPLSPAEARAIMAEADFWGPLIGWSEKRTRLTWLGHATVEGRAVVELVVAGPRGETERHSLDAETFLLARKLRQRPIGGRIAEVETVYQEYKPVEGVPVARKALTIIDGRTTILSTIVRAEIRESLPDEMFAPPIPRT
jgi:hypothetical protein